MTQAIRTANFIGSLGVNTHLYVTSNQYWDAGTVVSDLKYLGISQVRDAAVSATNMGQGSYAQLAAAGIKFDMIITGGSSISSDISELNAFETANPGSIEAIEGPNEVNITPFTYNGLTGTNAAVQYQSDLYNAVESDSLLSNIPVYNFTDAAAGVAGSATFGNVHAYAVNGQQPLQALTGGMALQASAMVGKSMVLTEAGYSSLPVNSVMDGVDQATQAKLTLNMIMDATKLGYSDIFLYQLLDGSTGSADTNVQDYFGLFNSSNVPKPVATAIHDLTSILADTGSNAATFTTGSLNYSLSNMPSTASSLLMEKSSGVYDLVLWNEPQIWNSTTKTEITAKATTVTVKLGATYGTVDVYDPLTGTTAILEEHNVSQIQVSLTDHPLIIQVSNASTSTPIVNTPLTITGPHVLYGSTSGNSVLNDNVGATTLAGYGGGNTYVVSHANDVIEQGASTAVNTIESSVSFTMPTNIGVMDLTGSGNLTGTANNGTATIVGNSGNDTLYGGSGTDTLIAGSGNDVIHAGTGATTEYAGAGTDSLYGGSGTTVLIGGAGTATMTAGSGATTFVAKTGIVTEIGGSGHDYFEVDNTADIVQAQANGGFNTLQTTVSYTAPTNVTNMLATGTSSVTLTANSGNITVTGNNAGDTLIGGSGSDVLTGGTGGDTFIVGAGQTTINSGGGTDHFIFKAIADTGTTAHPDVINGFTSADVIDLSGIATGLSGGASSAKFIGAAAFDHHAGELHYTMTSNGLLLSGDMTGSGTPSFEILLSHVTSITAQNILW